VTGGTRRLFREDPYRLEFEALVVRRLEHEGRPAVVLDQTAFYAESGGQPFDLGDLSGVPVVAVVEAGDEVVHVLERPLVAPTASEAAAPPSLRVEGRVDEARRRDHRQQHHGQHLLSRAFLELFGARTVAFHLGPEVSSVDLDRELRAEQLATAERRANEVVREARPVEVRVVSRSEALALGVAPPEEAGDAVRLVEARGFDLQPCGGTHPRSTAEVGAIALAGHERHKGGSRVRFLCGDRVLRTLRQQSEWLDRLAEMLSTPRSGVVATVERLLAQTAQARKDHEALLGRTLKLEAAELYRAARGGAGAVEGAVVVAARFDDRPPDELHGLATALTSAGPCVALLGGAFEGKAHLVFAQSPGAGRDLPGLLKASLPLVSGRGGGKGDLARGGGDRREGLDEALATAARAAEGARGER
jgi:alanyl-tRNA synthetase